MKWKFNILTTERTQLSVCWLPEKRTRSRYHNGHLCAVVRPLIEVGIDDQTVERIYYIGLCRLVIGLLRRPKEYVPFWSNKESEYTKNIISLSSYRTLHKHRKKNAPFTKLITR